MRALVIGGAGFVGLHLVRHLKEIGYEIIVTKMLHEMIDIPDIEIYDLDILEKGAVLKLLKETMPDYIFLLAAQSSVAVSWIDPARTKYWRRMVNKL